MFHIGDITRTVGNAFACSPEENWKDNRRFAPSGLNVMRTEASYNKLVNREAKRDVNNETNFIFFHVPITVMNMEETPVGIERMVTFHAEINDKEVWSGTTAIKILAADESTPEGLDPAVKEIVRAH